MHVIYFTNHTMDSVRYTKADDIFMMHDEDDMPIGLAIAANGIIYAVCGDYEYFEENLIDILDKALMPGQCHGVLDLRYNNRGELLIFDSTIEYEEDEEEYDE